MGRVGAPYGVKGWFRVQTFTQTREALADYPRWWLGLTPQTGREYGLESWRLHAGDLVAKLVGIEDRSAAEAVRSCVITIPRHQLPRVAAEEYYWSDLVGLSVLNTRGECLGVVRELLQAGAQDVLVVQDETGQERLIPFVTPILQWVSLEQHKLQVEWERDY